MKYPVRFVSVALLALALMPAYSQVSRIHPDITADTTTGNRVITHLASGGGWDTFIVLINLGSTVANYTLRFYGDSGAPQAFPFGNGITSQSLGNQSVLSGPIPVGGLLLLQAQNVGNATTTGWALIDPSSTGDIGALAIFDYQTGQQATVPIETASTQKFVIGFSNVKDTTGLALVNPHTTAVNINVVFRDSNGGTLVSDQFMMSPMQHMSFLLPDKYPALAGQIGTALITSDSPADAVAGLGILANSQGAYTTLFALSAQ